METWEILNDESQQARRPGLASGGGRAITTGAGADALDMPRGSFGASRPVSDRGRPGAGPSSAGGPRPGQPEVEIRDRVVELIQTTYRDFNDCHCTEKLREVEASGRPRDRPPPPAGPRPAPEAAPPAAAAPGAAAARRGHGRPRPHRRQPVRLAGHRHAPAPPRRHRRRTSTVLALDLRPAEDLHGHRPCCSGWPSGTACP